jgi:hypothetical protein
MQTSRFDRGWSPSTFSSAFGTSSEPTGQCDRTYFSAECNEKAGREGEGEGEGDGEGGREGG